MKRSKPTILRLDPEMHRRLKILCAELSITMNEIINFLIEEYIKEKTMENLNDTQKLVACISGYDGSNIISAHDDYYYENCHTTNEKMEQLKAYAENVEGIGINHKKVNYEAAYQFLESVFNAENDRFHAFKELKQ